LQEFNVPPDQTGPMLRFELVVSRIEDPEARAPLTYYAPRGGLGHFDIRHCDASAAAAYGATEIHRHPIRRNVAKQILLNEKDVLIEDVEPRARVPLELDGQR